jgi:mannose-1-phosphate guanylyltransferase
MTEETHLYAVIMAGGRGTRFWPLSREQRPKQLLPITGSDPLIRITVDRILPIIPADKILVVTGASHFEEVKELLPDLPPENILAEPEGRNTAPCIGLAAHFIHRRDPDGIMAVLPADHIIAKSAQFRSLIQTGADLARDRKVLVTLGITPTHPETGYGYIEAGPLDSELDGANAYTVARFHEKPNFDKAQQYYSSIRYFWNSGMFIWRAQTILSCMRELLPNLARDLEELAQTIGQPEFAAAMETMYPRLESVSIDYGIMEKASGVLVLPADIGWSDVGSWTSAAKHWPTQDGNVSQGDCLYIDSSGCVVYSPEKHVTLIGVDDLVVVDTPDALLICPKDRDQDIKAVVEALRNKGRTDLL